MCLSALFACAQAPTRFQIQGITADTSSGPLGSATVMLLQRKDSSLVNFTRSHDKGAFVLRNVKKGDYLLKVSFVGYIPFQKHIEFGDKELIDLGTLEMKAITKELFEVVVKTARAPLNIKGDTIEYNAASFKVPPGSTVEDLLRKLPGVQIDQDGNIVAQGQQVRKVTVDGKRFFGDDPKMATKNLPAEAITKVQIFNDKSEQAKVTGVDDGKKEKTVNLELKDGFKKGWIGWAQEHSDVSLLYGDMHSPGPQFVYGTEFHAPLNDHLAIYGQGNFIRPVDSGTLDAYVGLVFYLGGDAFDAPYRRNAPVHTVANNPMFALDLTR